MLLASVGSLQTSWSDMTVTGVSSTILPPQSIFADTVLVREAATGVVPFHGRLGYEVAPRVFMIEWRERAI